MILRVEHDIERVGRSRWKMNRIPTPTHSRYLLIPYTLIWWYWSSSCYPPCSSCLLWFSIVWSFFELTVSIQKSPHSIKFGIYPSWVIVIRMSTFEWNTWPFIRHIVLFFFDYWAEFTSISAGEKIIIQQQLKFLLLLCRWSILSSDGSLAIQLYLMSTSFFSLQKRSGK
jgi:hypothetical protein